jgi:hypothetical protein
MDIAILPAAAAGGQLYVAVRGEPQPALAAIMRTGSGVRPAGTILRNSALLPTCVRRSQGIDD